MAKNYKQSGKVLDHIAAAPIVSGQPVLIGALLGVALADIATGATGSVQVAGVFEVIKLGTDVVAQGANLYWDAGASRLTTTVGANTLAGVAAKAVGSGPTTVEILLNRMPG